MSRTDRGTLGIGDKVSHSKSGTAGMVVEVNEKNGTVLLEQGEKWLKDDECEVIVRGLAGKPNVAAEKHPSLGGLAVDDPKHEAEQLRADAVRDGFQAGDVVETLQDGRSQIIAEVNHPENLVRIKGDRDGVWRSYNEIEFQRRPSDEGKTNTLAAARDAEREQRVESDLKAAEQEAEVKGPLTDTRGVKLQ